MSSAVAPAALVESGTLGGLAASRDSGTKTSSSRNPSGPMTTLPDGVGGQVSEEETPVLVLQGLLMLL